MRTGRAHYHTEILTGGHALVADEPESLGGTDTGPTPFNLLLAALGACTTITLRMYADRKEWPLEEIGVRLRHQKRRPGEGTQPEGASLKVDEISQELKLIGSLDEEQRSRLFEIAHRCPVHRVLESGARMPMRLLE